MCHRLVYEYPTFELGRPFVLSTQVELNRSVAVSKVTSSPEDQFTELTSEYVQFNFV